METSHTLIPDFRVSDANLCQAFITLNQLFDPKSKLLCTPSFKEKLFRDWLDYTTSGFAKLMDVRDRNLVVTMPQHGQMAYMLDNLSQNEGSWVWQKVQPGIRGRLKQVAHEIAVIHLTQQGNLFRRYYYLFEEPSSPLLKNQISREIEDEASGICDILLAWKDLKTASEIAQITLFQNMSNRVGNKVGKAILDIEASVLKEYAARTFNLSPTPFCEQQLSDYSLSDQIRQKIIDDITSFSNYMKRIFIIDHELAPYSKQAKAALTLLHDSLVSSFMIDPQLVERSIRLLEVTAEAMKNANKMSETLADLKQPDLVAACNILLEAGFTGPVEQIVNARHLTTLKSHIAEIRERYKADFARIMRAKKLQSAKDFLKSNYLPSDLTEEFNHQIDVLDRWVKNRQQYEQRITRISARFAQAHSAAALIEKLKESENFGNMEKELAYLEQIAQFADGKNTTALISNYGKPELTLAANVLIEIGYLRAADSLAAALGNQSASVNAVLEAAKVKTRERFEKVIKNEDVAAFEAAKKFIQSFDIPDQMAAEFRERCAKVSEKLRTRNNIFNEVIKPILALYRESGLTDKQGKVLISLAPGPLQDLYQGKGLFWEKALELPLARAVIYLKAIIFLYEMPQSILLGTNKFEASGDNLIIGSVGSPKHRDFILSHHTNSQNARIEMLIPNLPAADKQILQDFFTCVFQYIYPMFEKNKDNVGNTAKKNDMSFEGDYLSDYLKLIPKIAYKIFGRAVNLTNSLSYLEEIKKWYIEQLKKTV